MKTNKNYFLLLLSLIVLISIFLVGCLKISPDILVRTDTTSLEFIGESQKEIKLLITPINGFTGNVEISLNDSSLFNINNLSLNIQNERYVSVQLIKPDNTPPGSYNISLKIKTDSSVKYVPLIINVRDFEIKIVNPNNSPIEVYQNVQSDFPVIIESLNKFSDDLELKIEDEQGNPYFSFITLEPSTLTLNMERIETIFKVKVSDTLSPGQYNLVLSAKSKKYNLVRKYNFTLNVIGTESQEATPSFEVISDTNNFTIEQGGSQSVGMTITPANGFTGTVNFELQTIAGSTAPTGISISPSVIDVPDNQSVPFTLTIFVDSSVTPGTYNLRIRAYDTSNTIEKFVYITLNVTGGQVVPDPSFDVVADSNNFTIEQGGSQSVGMTITPANGFIGTVNFELQDAAGGIAPTGISISPSVIDVPDNQSVPFVLTIFVDSSVTPGTYNLRIRTYDTSNTIEKFVYITLNVTSGQVIPDPSFSITTGTNNLTIEQGGSQSVSMTITPANGFIGTVNFELQDAAGGTAPTGISISPSVIDVPDNQSVPFTLTIFVDSSVTPGTYNLRIRAYDTSNTIEKFVYITLNVTGGQVVPDPSFDVVADSNNFTIEQGGSQSVGMTITPANGFIGTVNFELQDAAGGIAPTGISISPSVIDVPDNQSVPFVLTIFVDSSVTPGTYNLRIRTYDTSNTIEKFVYITLNVTSGQVIPDPSFSITTGTNNLTIEQGGSQSVSMTITPTNGFTGAVNFELQDAAGGIAPTGISISPSVIDVPDNQSVPFTLTVFVDSSVTPGTYTLRIRAYDSSNTIEKFIYITLNVTGGFDITIETYDFTLNTNSATTTHLTITPHSGFTGTINLELQDVSTGLPSNDITISPTQVIVEDLNPISLLITLSVSSTANVGVHNLRIEASSGNIKRYLYINIVVQ